MTVVFGRSLNLGKCVFMRRWVDWFTLMVTEKKTSKKTEEAAYSHYIHTSIHQ